MKLTEAKLKALILETMEEETLSDEQKENLLNLLRHDDPDTQRQGLESAAALVDKEDWKTAFDSQLLHMNGTMLVDWLKSGSSRGPRRALDKFMKVPDDMSKRKRESELKGPYGKEWNKPISEGSKETWIKRLYQMQGALEKVANSGDFYAWEKEWSDFKEFLRSFYEIHAPGFWDSLSDEEQMNTIYNRRNKPEEAIRSFNKSQGVLNPSWRLALPLARELSRVKRDWSWSNGYSDWDEGLEEPREPNNPKYMEGWKEAILDSEDEPVLDRDLPSR